MYGFIHLDVILYILSELMSGVGVWPCLFVEVPIKFDLLALVPVFQLGTVTVSQYVDP